MGLHAIKDFWVKRQLMHGACIEYDVTKLYNAAK